MPERLDFKEAIFKLIPRFIEHIYVSPLLKCKAKMEGFKDVDGGRW